MEVPAPVATPNLLDQTGTITVDMPCRRCGYNLRGLNQYGRCPECGAAIGLSTHGDLLRFADPEWVEKLARGVRFILWGIVVAVVIGALGGALGAMVHPGIGLLVSLAGGLLSLYGAWLLTEPDPSRIGEDRFVTARKIVRVTLLVGLCGNMLGMIGPNAPPRLMILVAAAAVAIGLVGVVGEFAKFLYYEKLALRIPDPPLARRARFLRWAYASTLAAAAVMGGLVLLLAATRKSAGGAGSIAGGTGPQVVVTSTGGAGMPSGLFGVACVGVVIAIAFLVFGIMTLRLVVRLGRHFREQARLARETWAADSAAGGTPPPPVARPAGA